MPLERHFTTYVDQVKGLRKSGRDAEAESLLLEMVEATEAESGMGVAPWPYEQLAIIYAKRGDLDGEIAILERFAKQRHAPGVKPPKLLERLEKKRKRRG